MTLNEDYEENLIKGGEILNLNTNSSLFFRLSPLEWESAHPCESDPSELENGLNLLNCLWHNIGALMQQGSDLAPK